MPAYQTRRKVSRTCSHSTIISSMVPCERGLQIAEVHPHTQLPAVCRSKPASFWFQRSSGKIGFCMSSVRCGPILSQYTRIHCLYGSTIPDNNNQSRQSSTPLFVFPAKLQDSQGKQLPSISGLYFRVLRPVRRKGNPPQQGAVVV